MKKNILLIFLLINFILLSSQINAASNSNKIIMASIRKENSYDGKFLKLLFNDAFTRIGKELVFKYYPAKRGTMMVSEGRVDGELARVYHYDKMVKNLIRVEEPVLSIKFIAYSTKNIKLNGWKSLENTNYRVDYLRGTKICEVYLNKIVDSNNLSSVSNWSQGLKKLKAGRTDIYIEVERSISNVLDTDEFINSKIHPAGLMEEITVHAFLHTKHKYLAPQLSNALKKIKEEGLIEKYNNIAKTN